jgi:hypothetical protein
MHRLKIQSVRSVPPIPTMIIVIPNVQLSMSRYLLMIYSGVMIQIRASSLSKDDERLKHVRGSPEGMVEIL